MQETWKSIKGFDGLYEVSNTGRVRTLKHRIVRNNGRVLDIPQREIKGSKDTKGYYQVELKKEGKRNIKFVHRLVAETFIENNENKQQVNHKDGNKENNDVSNLEWVTCKENIHHAWKNQLNKPCVGENHGNHKLTDDAVGYIKEHYKPRDKEYGARALARKFNVSPYPVMQVVHGKGWKHIQ